MSQKPQSTTQRANTILTQLRTMIADQNKLPRLSIVKDMVQENPSITASQVRQKHQKTFRTQRANAILTQLRTMVADPNGLPGLSVVKGMLLMNPNLTASQLRQTLSTGGGAAASSSGGGGAARQRRSHSDPSPMTRKFHQHGLPTASPTCTVQGCIRPVYQQGGAGLCILHTPTSEPRRGKRARTSKKK